MKLQVVIVNYKTAELALRALDSAIPEVVRLGGRITVVDNASGDGSAERLEAGIRERGDVPVDFVLSEKNGGFGYGNNLAIRRGLASADPPELVYLLNPDAVAAPGAIGRLVEFMDAHPECGIAGSHITEPDGSTHVSAFRFPSPLGEVEGTLRLGLASRVLQRWSVWGERCDRTCRVDWVSGASTIIRREVLEGVGMFDENFFLYFEETDLCRRATLAGWQIWFVREASVEHLRAVSTGLKDVARPMPAYWFQSRRYYFLKQGGSKELWLANLAWLAGQSVWRVRRRIQRKPDVDPPNLLFDFVRHNVAAARSRTKR